MINSRSIMSLLAFLGLIMTGCSGHQQTFEGYDPDSVWTALTAAAQAPNYDDMEPGYQWSVRENEVWTDPAVGRIEIYRRLQRTITKPVKMTRSESRLWTFQIVYDPTPVACCSQ